MSRVPATSSSGHQGSSSWLVKGALQWCSPVRPCRSLAGNVLLCHLDEMHSGDNQSTGVSKVVQETNLAREFIQSSNTMASPYHVQALCSSCIILDMLQESSTNTDHHLDLDRNELRLELHSQLVPYSPVHHASSSSAYGRMLALP